jgi:hypothetical protein
VLAHQATTCDLLFITLRLPGRRPACRRHWSEALFSPSTRFRDLALGSSLFHWESQCTTASATGQRYIHHETRGSRVLLYRCAEAFGNVREQRRQRTVTEPFVCLGFARYESHEGERPMAGGNSGVAAGAGDSVGMAARLLCGTPAVPRDPWRWRFEGGLFRALPSGFT